MNNMRELHFLNYSLDIDELSSLNIDDGNLGSKLH